MIIKYARFIKSAVKPSQYPISTLPEIAFAGRSNVGKSSLINTLVNRKRLVKTGSTPGRTQLINFFEINKNFHFVDLPGYGYAKVPVNLRKSWGPMIETYLSLQKFLCCVVLIIDIRRTPSVDELNFIDWLKQHSLPCIFVITKADKLSKTKRASRRLLIANKLNIHKNEPILFSAKSRQGKEALWEKLKKVLNKDAAIC
mmetsp:Transcript_620/g.464  ORF Transcript_620/g.464 Transcript_620/m.464 type:complete len:200 (-) Transcript_620:195-794(-)